MCPPLEWLDEQELGFPDPASALSSPNGLLAVGGDLRPERVLRAYQAGIFPWFEEGQPILWWSPDPRMVLFPDEVHLSRSMRRFLRSHRYRISSDTAFAAVIRACAASRVNSSGTWITPAMMDTYIALHHAGHAHSVEVWEGEELVGGIYGIAMGRVFFGESMFSRRSNTSKLALAELAGRLQQADYTLIDCQVESAHLGTLGARCIPRQQFLELLPAAEDIGRVARWPYNTPDEVDQSVASP